MQDDDITQLIARINAGDDSVHAESVKSLYQELRRMAGGLMRNERSGHTLQPTALVNEAYLALMKDSPEWKSREHFFGAAVLAMRRILVAHARQRAAQKRGGAAIRVTFQDFDAPIAEPSQDILELDDALAALWELDARLAKVVELRYFAGLELKEIAQLTGTSLATVKRDWTFAKAWLTERLGARLH